MSNQKNEHTSTHTNDTQNILYRIQLEIDEFELSFQKNAGPSHLQTEENQSNKDSASQKSNSTQKLLDALESELNEFATKQQTSIQINTQEINTEPLH